MADLDLSALEALHAAAFRAPWTHTTWTVECEQAEGDCANSDDDRCDDYHDVETLESHDEYPNGQVVAQIDRTTPSEVSVPGLKTLAERNAAFICALRNAAPELLRLARIGQEAERDLAAMLGDENTFRAQDYSDSPPFTPEALKDLAERGFVRVNRKRGGAHG